MKPQSARPLRARRRGLRCAVLVILARVLVGQQDPGEQIVIAIRPEQIVVGPVAVRPERVVEKVVVGVRPEHRPGPADEVAPEALLPEPPVTIPLRSAAESERVAAGEAGGAVTPAEARAGAIPADRMAPIARAAEVAAPSETMCAAEVAAPSETMCAAEAGRGEVRRAEVAAAEMRRSDMHRSPPEPAAPAPRVSVLRGGGVLDECGGSDGERDRQSDGEFSDHFIPPLLVDASAD